MADLDTTSQIIAVWRALRVFGNLADFDRLVAEAHRRGLRLDRGVDGFRVDVLWLLIKDDQFRDNPVNPGYVPGESSHDRLLPFYTANRPEVHAIVAEIRSVTDPYPDRVLIGETYLPIEQLITYYGHDLKGAHLPFNFQLLQTAWNAASIAQIMEEYQAALPHGAWPNWILAIALIEGFERNEDVTPHDSSRHCQLSRLY